MTTRAKTESKPHLVPHAWLRQGAALLASASVFGATGCAQLPTIVPDQSRRSASALKVSDASGPLSAQRLEA